MVQLDWACSLNHREISSILCFHNRFAREPFGRGWGGFIPGLLTLPSSQSLALAVVKFITFPSMRTGNPPDELEVLVIFRVLRAGYRVVLLRLVGI